MAEKRNLEELTRYGRILAGQARDIATQLGENVATKRYPNNQSGVEQEVSDAHELLANIRMRVPGEVDPVAWERTTVDGRTAEEIFERLGDVIHEFSRMK
jgi:hypothetical protein